MRGPGLKLGSLARSRATRISASLAILLFLGSFAPVSAFVPPPYSGPATISFVPVPLDEDAPQKRRLGALTYLAGWELRSDNAGFGGISAMHVADDAVLALSDAGTLIRFPVPRRRGTVRGSVDPLGDGPGSATVKSDRDSESLMVAGGKAWVGFERTNMIWRYSARTWRSDAHAAPPPMSKWPENSGAEALLRLPDGRFLVFAEAAPGPKGSSAVLLFGGDPAMPATPALWLGYRAPEGYRVTDAALLPDGRLIILNRRFTIFEGVSAKLVVADLPPLAAGAIIQGKEIADFQPPTTVDNMEALSVTKEGGRTIVWLASDDNFNPLQRSLLLKFAFEVGN